MSEDNSTAKAVGEKPVPDSNEKQKNKEPRAGRKSVKKKGNNRRKSLIPGRRSSVNRRTVFAPKSRQMSKSRMAFVSEVFRLRKTIIVKVFPQLLISMIVGFFAQYVKKYVVSEEGLPLCDDIVSTDDCPITFDPSGHSVIAVVLGFLLVFRTDLAYDRYYEGKGNLGSIYCGIRNLNIAFTAFLRVPKVDEMNYKRENRSALTLKLARDRVELLRLTNLLYAFIRQALREQRHGYSDTGPVSDTELMNKDRAGRPTVAALFKNELEQREFDVMEYYNRPNIIMARIQSMIEHHRRMGNISERAALDVFADCADILQAFKGCERIVTTPIPYTYLHMLNFLLFMFVFTVPFVFSSSFKWATPIPCAIMALSFYGVNEIGRCMEDPFKWDEPCHDLTAIGWRVYRENTVIHEKLDLMEKDELLKEKELAAMTGRNRFKSIAQVAPVLGSAVDTKSEEEEQLAAKLRAEAEKAIQLEEESDDEIDDEDYMERPKEYGNSWHTFFTEFIQIRGTVIPRIAPQLLLAGLMGLFANWFKIFMCDPDDKTPVVTAADCPFTLESTAHNIVGVVLGFLLVFRVSLAYSRFYDGKGLLGEIYCGLRNLNIATASYLRPARREEPGYAGTDNKYRTKLAEDRVEVLRLSNIMYAFMRQYIRESRLGYVGYHTKPTGDELLENDRVGRPAVENLIRNSDERKEFAAISVGNRPNYIMAKIQEIIEHHRRIDHISERGAFEIYKQLEFILDAFKGCERIVSTPIPYTYLQMAQLILFAFVFTIPFVFSATFKWAAPFPSVILALSFYGIDQIGVVLEDPFEFEAPCHDLSAIGQRIFVENLQLHEDLQTIEASYGSLGAGSKLLSIMAKAKNQSNVNDAPASPTKKGQEKTGINASKMKLEKSGQALDEGMFGFITNVFHWKNTVLRSLFLPILCAIIIAMLAQYLKLNICGDECPDVTKLDYPSCLPDSYYSGKWTQDNICREENQKSCASSNPECSSDGYLAEDTNGIGCFCSSCVNSHMECWICFNNTAHLVIGGILGFLLVFRTNIAYYRYYEGKGHMGSIYSAIRNVNVAFLSFLRTDIAGEKNYKPGDAKFESMKIMLFNDHKELRRFTNILYAFIRQAIREQRNGYPDISNQDMKNVDKQLIYEDKYGKPSLKWLLTEDEKKELLNVDFNNRPNIIVARMQMIIEHHRRLGHISERGAFDIYHDLEKVLEGFKNCERVVSTKMPYQYMHMAFFLLFIFVFSAPFVFSASFKYVTFFPSAVISLGFYGIAEIGSSIEDPFNWKEPNHDVTGIGWRIFQENLQLHEQFGMHSAKQSVRCEQDNKLLEVSDAKDMSANISIIASMKQSTRRSFVDNDADLVKSANSQQDFDHSVIGFLTELFRLKNTIHKQVLPQVVLATAIGVVAQYLKILFCGHEVESDADCVITFAPHAHFVVGNVLGFMLVFRVNLAYDRYYEAKNGLSTLHNGLRNLNICVVSFLSPPQPGEPKFSEGPSYHTESIRLARDRAEILRLSGVLFGFIRQSLREQRIGYPEVDVVSDAELLSEDPFGKPSLSSLLSISETEEFLKVPFNNRPNLVVTKIQNIVEHNRLLGFICDRGAHDIYNECELILDALKSCERVVSTPVPFQYLHMLNFVLFCFVFSAPFVFTSSFKYITPLPSAILALGFYGIGKIGEAIEYPFDWAEPNHDLTGVGQRIWKENLQIHSRVVVKEKLLIPGVDRFIVELSALSPKIPTLKPKKSFEEMETLRDIRLQRLQEGLLVGTRTMPRASLSFLVEVFQFRHTVIKRCLPQLIFAFVMGFVAQIIKVVLCGEFVMMEGECDLTFDSSAHAIASGVIGFLLVFRTNLAYEKYYDGKVAVGEVYDGLRNMNISFVSFIHAKTGTPESKKELRQDLSELRRLTNLMYAFIRQAIREQHHGYKDQVKVSDNELLTEDRYGNPRLPSLFVGKELDLYSKLDFNNRPNLVAAHIQRIVERHRRLGNIYEKSAFDIYSETERVLAATKTCEKIVTTPIPYQYLHMLNFVLFFYVYTGPFIFTTSFKWASFFPSIVLALGFYGIAEIGNVIEDCFDWSAPCHDLSGYGANIFRHTKAIHEYEFCYGSTELMTPRITDESVSLLNDIERAHNGEKSKPSLTPEHSEDMSSPSARDGSVVSTSEVQPGLPGSVEQEDS